MNSSTKSSGTQKVEFIVRLILITCISCGQPQGKVDFAPPPLGVPQYVFPVLQYVQQYETPLPGYVGGRVFHNREQRLPLLGKEGQIARYREWDVHPKVPGESRGAERLLTSEDGSAWYTPDHYRSFIPLPTQIK